jgi:hypothetical protein
MSHSGDVIALIAWEADLTREVSLIVTKITKNSYVYDARFVSRTSGIRYALIFVSAAGFASRSIQTFEATFKGVAR